MISTSYNPGLQSSNPAGVNLLKQQIAVNTSQIQYLMTQGGGTAPEVTAELLDHENRIDALEAIDPNQNAKITALEAKDVVHETRMTNIELVNTNQDAAIAILQNTPAGVSPLYTVDFVPNAYAGSNRIASDEATLIAAIANSVTGDKIDISQPITLTSKLIINKGIKFSCTGSGALTSSLLDNMIDVTANDVYFNTTMKITNIKTGVDNYAVKVTNGVLRFTSLCPISFTRFGIVIDGAQFLIQGTFTLLGGYAQSGVAVNIWNLLYDSTVQYLITTRANTESAQYYAIWHASSGVFDAKLTVANCSQLAVNVRMAALCYINLPTKTVGKKPQLHLINNTFNGASAYDNQIILKTGNSLDFFDTLLVRNNRSMNPYCSAFVLFQCQTATPYSPCPNMIVDGNTYINFNRTSSYTYFALDQVAYLTASFTGGNDVYDRQPNWQVRTLTNNMYKVQDQQKPLLDTIFSLATYNGTVREVKSTAELTAAIAAANHFDVIKFKASFTMTSGMSVTKSLKFTNDDQYLITMNESCQFSIQTNYIFFDQTCRFDAINTTSQYPFQMTGAANYFSFRGELKFRCTAFFLTNSFEITGQKFSYTTSASVQHNFAYVNNINENSSIHDVKVLQLSGTDGLFSFIQVATSAAWNANLNIMNCVLPTRVLGNFFYATNPIINYTNHLASLNIVGCQWSATVYDIVLQMISATNYSMFKNILIKNNIVGTNILGNNYYGLLLLFNNSSVITLYGAPITFDGNVLNDSPTLSTSCVSIIDKLLTRTGLWIDTNNAFAFYANNRKDLSTLQQYVKTNDVNLNVINDKIDVIKNNAIITGNVESIWNENPLERYYSEPVVNGMDQYETNIQIQCDGQTISDLDSSYYNIPNVSQTITPNLLSVSNVVPYVWVKYNRYVYPQPTNSAGNWFQNDTGILMDNSYNFLSQGSKTYDVKFPFIVVKADAGMQTQYVNINVSFAFQDNLVIKYGRLDPWTSAQGVFKGCSNMIDYSCENGQSVPVDYFRNCINLMQCRVNQPITIGANAFYNTPKMVGELDLRTCDSIGDSAFYGSGVTTLYMSEKCVVGSNCFQGCAKLQTVIYNESQGTISSINLGVNTTYRDCVSLVDFVAINMTKIKTIPSQMFYGCTNFNVSNYLTFSYVTQYNGSAAFGNCANLSGVEGVLHLSYNAASAPVWSGLELSTCLALRKLYIKTGSSGDIPYFANNGKITHVVYSGAAPTALSGSGFYMCGKLQCFDTVESSLVDFGSVVTIGANTFYGCVSVKSFRFKYDATLGGNCMYICKPDFINWVGGVKTVTDADLLSWGISGYNSFTGSGTAQIQIQW